MTAILERPVLTHIRPVTRPNSAAQTSASMLVSALTTAEYNEALAAYARVAQPLGM